MRGTATSDLAFFAIAAILCWLFSLGRYCEIVYRVIFSLPFGDYLRAPVKWHHLTEFCLCVLAGYGIEWLRWLRGLRWLRWLRGLRGELIIGAIILIGVCDLARIDRLYCAPVDLREARRQNCNFQMTFLRRSDFANPQVKAMVNAKRIVPLAQPNQETYLVGVLTPRGPRKEQPWPPMTAATWLGVLSMFSTVVMFGSVWFLRRQKLAER